MKKWKQENKSDTLLLTELQHDPLLCVQLLSQSAESLMPKENLS